MDWDPTSAKHMKSVCSTQFVSHNEQYFISCSYTEIFFSSIGLLVFNNSICFLVFPSFFCSFPFKGLSFNAGCLVSMWQSSLEGFMGPLEFIWSM